MISRCVTKGILQWIGEDMKDVYIRMLKTLYQGVCVCPYTST